MIYLHAKPVLAGLMKFGGLTASDLITALLSLANDNHMIGTGPDSVPGCSFTLREREILASAVHEKNRSEAHGRSAKNS